LRYVFGVCCLYASQDKLRLNYSKLLREEKTKRKMGVKGKAEDKVHPRIGNEGTEGGVDV